MLPINFKEENRPPLGKPDCMTDEQCMSLPVFSDGSQYWSCWQPNKEDIEAINAGKPIWLNVLGAGHPPVSLQTDYPFRYLKDICQFEFIKEYRPTMIIDEKPVVIPGYPVISAGSYLMKVIDGWQVYNENGMIDGRLFFHTIEPDLFDCLKQINPIADEK